MLIFAALAGNISYSVNKNERVSLCESLLRDGVDSCKVCGYSVNKNQTDSDSESVLRADVDICRVYGKHELL